MSSNAEINHALAVAAEVKVSEPELSLVGRDRVIVEELAEDLLGAVMTRFEYSEVKDIRRGSWFGLKLPTGHVVRVTVQLDFIEPRDGFGMPIDASTPG